MAEREVINPFVVLLLHVFLGLSWGVYGKWKMQALFYVAFVSAGFLAGGVDTGSWLWMLPLLLFITWYLGRCFTLFIGVRRHNKSIYQKWDVAAEFKG